VSAPDFSGGLALVPPPAPPTPAEDEASARQEMLRALGWRVEVSAPPWREVLFLGKPRLVVLPKIPDGVVARLRNLQKEAFAPSDIGVKALALAETLKSAMPTGAVPRSLGAARELPPPQDAVQSWTRQAIVTACGPELVPLLVSGGFLTQPDVDVLDATYPAGMDEVRLAATEAAAPMSAAAKRAGHASAFPAWLDDQTMTLMGEPADTDQSVHEPDQSQQQPGAGGNGQGGPSASGGGSTGGDSKIANQFRPQPGPESAQ
jgi:hypothetical protein